MGRHLASPVILRMGALLVIAWIVSQLARWSKIATEDGDRSARDSRGWTWFFLLLALAGSIPVMLSARIAGHYFVPSIALYALAFASLSVPAIAPLLDRFRARPTVRKLVGGFGILLFVAAFVIPLLGGSLEPRDVAWMSEYRALSSSVPRGETLGTCEAVRTDWGLHAYMQRFFEVGLDSDNAIRHRYYLKLTDRPCDTPSTCEVIATTARLALYQCPVGSR
jgi:hypothetical protein